MEVVASLSQGRTAAAQCGLFTYKSFPVIFEPPFIQLHIKLHVIILFAFKDPQNVVKIYYRISNGITVEYKFQSFC